ncbi:hypothetical protein [Mycobacterium sp. AZCC_0083]|uniref:hypothetical protein n=1 Tax=Mycobacterium sp. AZCC_0083 TaxID=2735882 RepID=UPI00160C1B62|nr:hypothetical protein [Mycobacterium sp. AZCC_0083]MBB5161821.1 hypothetical protein [Mycobacterium sp. AZCC_0083]
MRFVAALLMWVLTTAALAVAVPAAWAQHNVIDEAGYATLATSAAKDPAVQSAMAAELTSQLVTLAANSGYDVRPDLLSGAATAYTRSAAFPGQFAQANRIVHRWLFTDIVQTSDASGRWQIDLSPMLADSSFQETLRDFGIRAPSTLVVPLTENVSDSLRPGQLRQVARWGPWASVGAMVLTGVLALLTLAVARSRGKALGALGVSALIVGAAGWAGIEVAQRYVDRALNQTTGDIRDIAQAMVGHAEGSLHQWLNLTLAAGGALVLFGVVVSMVGGLLRKSV